MIIGYMVEIDWSQTDRDYVIVLGAKSRQEAADYVRERGCNCPRIYGMHPIKKVYNTKA